MEWFKLSADVLVGIAWPVTLVIGLIIFRKPIADLISRRPFKIGKEGVEFGAIDAQTSQGKIQQAPDKFVKPAEHPNKLIKPFLEQMEALVKSNLDMAASENTKIDREAFLVRIAADSAGARYLELAYRSIFGSQIAALDALQSLGGTGSIQLLQEQYNDAVLENPDFYQSFSFDQWFGYLAAWGLVEVSGSDVRLTSAGSAFIPHIASLGYPLRLPG